MYFALSFIMFLMYTIHFLCIGEDHPSLKDLYIHVLQEAADRWRDIGVLLLDPAILKVIEKDHPQDVMGCCKCMLEKWLESKPDGSWNQLLEALKSPCIQLNTLAQQIEQKLRKKSKTTLCWGEGQLGKYVSDVSNLH